MSAINAFTQSGTIETAGSQGISYSTLGFGSIGFSLAGTFTSGTITLEGTIDGNSWTVLAAYKAQTSYTSITTTGNYIASVVGYTEVKLVPDSFVGQLLVTANITTPFFFLGASGMISTLTAELPLLSSGGADPVLSISGLTAYGTANQVMRMNAGATALEWYDPTVGNITGVTGTSPIIVTSGSGPVPDVTLAGMTGVGSANQVVMSNGTIWGYESTTGTGNVVRAISPTFTGTVAGAASNWSGSMAVSFSNASIVGFALENTDVTQVWTMGISGSAASLAPAGALLFRDSSLGMTRAYIETDGDAVFTENLDADSFSVGGVAGAAGGTFTTITSITVVNGIITAISGS
jgi:hypothetical protein